jgi:hypothetical protein
MVVKRRHGVKKHKETPSYPHRSYNYGEGMSMGKSTRRMAITMASGDRKRKNGLRDGFAALGHEWD